MTADDYVRAIHVFNEKNPQPNVVSVRLGPPPAGQAINPRAARDSQRIMAIAEMNDGSFCPTRSTSSSPSRLAWRTRSDGPHPHQRSAKAKKGEVIAIKTLISHEMETGYRHDNVGKAIPRDIITQFVCTYNGLEYFAPTSSRRSPPIRSSRSSRSRRRAARSSSGDRRQRLLADRDCNITVE